VDVTRTAVVTGASSGIGRAIAVALGALGWNVAVGARRTDALAETAVAVTDAGGTAFAHALDVADPESVASFVARASEAFGPLDVLVNNAGCAWPGDIATIDPDRLRDMLATNVLGALLPSRAVVARLLDDGLPGDVVFISSDAVHNPRPGLVTYGATKAAAEHIARGLAYELEGTGIRVTTVRVGPTVTDFAAGWGDPQEFAAMVERWQHFGNQRHWGVMDPTDVARAVVLAVTTPAGVHLDTIEVVPMAPRPA
jgi:NADP-dependent 3-hydroxy acid dehydrogenase YdfG